MKRLLFTFLFLVASVGMMNAKVTWNSSNISDLYVSGTYQSYSKEGVTLGGNAEMVDARWWDYGDESMIGISFNTHETGGFTFSNSLGKNFTKIEMLINRPGGWDYANLGSGWSFPWDYDWESPVTVTWTGNASTVDLLKEASDFGGEYVKSIVFYFEGDSEAPDPTYTVALKAGTANADKVTLSATSAVEGATVTITPNEEYEITDFSAYYVVVNGQVGSINEIDATLNAETGAYSFTMPAYDVTIEATIAVKLVPEGDIFAGFTATAGSGGFDNEGHANLVDNKFTSGNWTKWCTKNDHKSVPTGESGDACWWIDFEASAALNPTGYILTTGNDSGSEHGRNPKNWVLKAKLNAGDAWTTIATVTNDVTMKNQSFKDYKFFVDQSGSYKYFRFEVFANQGANVMQLCQLRLIGTDAPDPAPATTVWTSLSVGDVIKVGDKIEVPAEGDGSWGINGNVLRNTWGPYELIRADIYQASESVDPVVTETEDGAFYVFKAENSDFYPLSNVAKAGGLVVTMTSDGLEVTAAENKEFTVAVHEGGAPAYETVMNLINEIPNPAVLTAECKAKIDAAREAYDALSTDDKELITNIATLTKAETDYTALNQAEADKVIAKIAAIPQPVELKLATRDSIESARAAYDALTAEQKALVSNYTDLTDAEAALAALNPGTAPSTPLDQAQAVKDLIEAIPAEITLDDNCVKAIDDARAAYDALRTEVQGALDDATVAKLTGAEDALALLKADHDAANAVIAKINAIGDVEYTTESKALIDAAREAYDALTEGQQALVTNSATLTTAESTYASLKAAADLTAAAYDLNTLIESAQEDYKSVAALPKYASIAEQLLDAINTAKGIAENSEATLSELQTAKTNLQTAYDKFNDDMSGTVTNVDKVNTDASESDIWFDLSGRRLQGKPTTPGLYINNGRKTIVK